MPKNYCIMQIWAESGKSALPICNYSQILYQFLTFTQNLKRSQLRSSMDCQHFFRQIFLGYFPDIVQAFDTLGRNVYGDDYTSLHNPIVLSSVLLVYGMFHSTQILF